MADVGGMVFGSGSSSKQQTIADPTTDALNKIKLDQAMTVLGYPKNAGTGTGAFMQPGGPAYTPSPDVQTLMSTYGPDSNISMSDYLNLASGQDTNILNNAIGNVAADTKQGLDLSNANYIAEYNRAMQSGLDTTSNYISKIATPQIMQQMALQGLEGGGAVPEAIAKATAQAGMPMWQQLVQMAQQYLATQGGIQQAGQQQQAGLYGQEMPLQASLYQGAPQTIASSNAANAQAASTLFPIADYSRQLQEGDLLRRQGLMTTAWTGIPYTPTPTVKQGTGSQPLFNFFGQG